MPVTPEARAEAARLRALFEAAGAQPVEAAILQPAETLLDLYGEDIRTRAYVTSDPLRGEQMLRPDFTVPVVQMHMDSGAEPARYTYAGEVFRRQEIDPHRASEYLQTGFELFDGRDAAAADAEVFALIAGALEGLPVRPSTGDMSLLRAAVQGLPMSERRRAALLRHLWRPRRFRALLDRFRGRGARQPERARLLAGKIHDDAPQIGLRSPGEIAARIAALHEDAAEPPLSDAAGDAVDTLLGLREKAPNVLENLRDIAVDLPSIGPAVEAMARRLDALSDRGIDVPDLDFETTFGRTSLEYYDGFVFGFSAPGRTDLPPVATGGRYDALTHVLGRGRAIPAVGGVIRPEVVLRLKEGR